MIIVFLLYVHVCVCVRLPVCVGAIHLSLFLQPAFPELLKFVPKVKNGMW